MDYVSEKIVAQEALKSGRTLSTRRFYVIASNGVWAGPFCNTNDAEELSPISGTVVSVFVDTDFHGSIE